MTHSAAAAAAATTQTAVGVGPGRWLARALFGEQV